MTKRDRDRVEPRVVLLLLFFGGMGQVEASILTGTVLDQSEKPVPALVVRLLPPGEDTEIARSTTDEEGRFSFSKLTSGTYVLRVEGDQYRPWQKTVVLSAGPPTTLRITVERILPIVAQRVDVLAKIPRTTASASTIPEQELTLRAGETPGDVLERVPGVVITQPAGGGKADQFRIRGFDADHGTDLAIFFEGIPVNLVSHAHGQGYTDLNFLIPETLESVEVFKGPYLAEYGNLATGGVAQFQLREHLEHPFVRVEAGDFDTQRVVIGYSPETQRAKGFVAVEGFWTDGPFVHPASFQRFNLATRWSFPIKTDDQITLFATAYTGDWNASGQIPLREVEAGRLDRFGRIDPTEGGESSRVNLSVGHTKEWTTQAIRSQFYTVFYNFDLFSNFTFFRDDPVNGDGILQTDDRILFGGQFQYFNSHSFFGRRGLLTLGFDYRQDNADVGLFRQQERRILSIVANSDITEQNMSLYAQQEVQLGTHLKVVAGLRHEQFIFNIRPRNKRGAESDISRSITLPKLSLVITPEANRPFSIFLNYGRGFHSNDARAAVADPQAPVLPSADGYELGFKAEPWRNTQVSFAYWLLDLEGELVFAGDEGTTELRGPTRRHGPELALSWQVNESVRAKFDFTRSFGRFQGSGDPIPRAPRWTYNASVSFGPPGRFAGEFRLRGLSDFPLDDPTGRVRGEGYHLADLNASFRITPNWNLFASFQNLFDSEVKEAQTFFFSRLPSELAPVGDNHFTPGNPFTFRAGLQYTFDVQ